MSTAETVLREILEQRAIGAAKIGGSFSSMAQRYGDPTKMIDVKGFGFDERCRIWDYDEVQVWSDPHGTIDRVFFDTKFKQPECTNQNFVDDLADMRDKLKDCDVETFEQVLDDDRSKLKRQSTRTELELIGDGIEIFAIFSADEAGSPQRLVLLRLNTI